MKVLSIAACVACKRERSLALQHRDIFPFPSFLSLMFSTPTSFMCFSGWQQGTVKAPAPLALSVLSLQVLHVDVFHKLQRVAAKYHQRPSPRSFSFFVLISSCSLQEVLLLPRSWDLCRCSFLLLVCPALRSPPLPSSCLVCPALPCLIYPCLPLSALVCLALPYPTQGSLSVWPTLWEGWYEGKNKFV